MLELTGSVKERAATESSPVVERFMQPERSRTQQMIERSPFNPANNGVNLQYVLSDLQARFSHGDDLPQEIEQIIESQVEMRTRELFRQANYDDLTHLPNRAYFHSTLEQLVMRAQESGGEFTLLFLDLDGFKKVNDTFGHHAGDELLRNVGARLISAVREGDIVSRLGGDEFVILLAGLSDREMTENICRRIIKEVRRPCYIDQNDIRVSTSIGVAHYPSDAQTSNELVEKSDKALYASKDSGRNTFCFFHDLVASDHDLPTDRCFEAAMQSGQIEICFEPQVDLASQQVVGASVSALWHDERLESAHLSGWQALLSHNSASQAMATWLLDSGLYYLQQWLPENERLVVSVPVLDMLWTSQTDMVAFLQQRLNQYGISSSQLQLEVSLASVVKHDLYESLQALAEAGYQLTLSEVGSAPLDVVKLSALNLHEMKLDRDWLQHSLESEAGHKGLQAVVHMANALDITVIATGIESIDQLAQVELAGCSLGQGVFWARPLSVEEFAQVLELPSLNLSDLS